MFNNFFKSSIEDMFFIDFREKGREKKGEKERGEGRKRERH